MTNEEKARLFLHGEVGRALSKTAPLRVQANGHTLSDPRKSPLMYEGLEKLDAKTLTALDKALKSGNALRRMILLGPNDRDCHFCGAKIEWETNGRTLRTRSACTLPEGEDMIFELAVPSGVLMVGSGFYSGFGTPDDWFDIGTCAGMAQTTRSALTTGLVYVFVGNVCPALRDVGKDRFIVACPQTDELMRPIGKLAAQESRAVIVADCDVYTMADSLEFKRRKCQEPADAVKVRPGVYRITHHGYKKGFNVDTVQGDVIYSTIEWVRACPRKRK